MEEIDLVLEMAEENMVKALNFTKAELTKIRAGKASPQMLEGISVDYYGAPSPISQVSTISTPDARTLTIRPFEKSLIPAVEKAIIQANIGLNPMNDGEFIRLNIPPLTEERRIQLVKRAKNELETARINIRRVRQESNDELKALKNDGVSEDAIKIGEERVQKLTDGYVVKADQLLDAKEKDIMSV